MIIGDNSENLKNNFVTKFKDEINKVNLEKINIPFIYEKPRNKNINSLLLDNKEKANPYLLLNTNNSKKIFLNTKFNVPLYSSLTDKLLSDLYPKYCSNCNTLVTKILSTRPTVLRCETCNKQISRFKNTPLEEIKIPYWIFGYLLHELILTYPYVITAMEMKRKLGITHNTSLLLKKRLMNFCLDILSKINTFNEKQSLSPELQSIFSTKKFRDAMNNYVKQLDPETAKKQTFEYMEFSGMKKKMGENISKTKTRKNKEKRENKENKKTISREDLDFDKVNSKNNKRFFVTCISPLFVIHDKFFKTILNYCKINKAELVIFPMKGVKYHDEWDKKELERVLPYLATNYKFNDNLKGLDILLSPQQINPLTGLDRFGEKEFSIIVASPKQQMVTLTNTHNNIPHILHSTGMMCYNQISYRHNRIGKIASQDHILGGLIVEVKDHEVFFIRQVQANQTSGEFVDLNTLYTEDSSEDYTPEAIYFGDSHAGFEDDTAIKSAISQIQTLKPKNIFLGDVFDGHSISHHHINNITQQVNREDHVDTLEKELHAVAKHIQIFSKTFPDITIYIIRSNHDEHLDRYLNEGRYINDRINYKISLLLAGYHLQGFNPIEKWLEENYPDILSNVVFLKRDSSFKIANIECSAHGDISYNGIKATPLTLEKTYTKCTVGHAHTPKILRNVYVVGTMCKFKLSYTKGASSWNHTNCSIYSNGARQLLTTVNGDWKL